MEQQKIDRINALARKAKQDGLTDAEKAERDALRREYIAAVRANLERELDNTWIVDEKGNKTRLPHRKERKPKQ